MHRQSQDPLLQNEEYESVGEMSAYEELYPGRHSPTTSIENNVISSVCNSRHHTRSTQNQCKIRCLFTTIHVYLQRMVRPKLIDCLFLGSFPYIRGSRGLKGKTSKNLHENAKYLKKIVYLKNKNLFAGFFPTSFLMIPLQEDMRNKLIESGLSLYLQSYNKHMKTQEMWHLN